jgi:hypothetical protein
MKISPVVLFTAVLFVAKPALPQMQSLGAKDTFNSVGLSAKEAQEIVEEVERSAYDTPDDWKKELRVRRVDLGNSPGLVVQGSELLCGGTGNCQTWVFRKRDNKWMSLFPNDRVPIAEGFRLGPGITGGIKDFTIMRYRSDLAHCRRNSARMVRTRHRWPQSPHRRPLSPPFHNSSLNYCISQFQSESFSALDCRMIGTCQSSRKSPQRTRARPAHFAR